VSFFLRIGRDDREDSGTLFSMKIAITGANGYIGRLLRQRFTDERHAVIGLVRTPHSSDDLVWRLGDPAPLAGVDALVHCAWEMRADSQLNAVNVSSTEQLARECRDASVPMIFVSSMSAYDGSRQNYGRSKLAAEGAAASLGATVVRLGLVYSDDPADLGGMAGSLRKLTGLPIVPVIAGAYQFTAHADDVARAMSALLEAYGPSGAVTGEKQPPGPIGLANPNRVPFRAIIDGLSPQSHLKIVTIPASPVYWGLKAAERAHVRLPFTSDNFLGLIEPATDVVGQDVLRSLGVAFRAFGE
jgi:nucleoside-diphosphate-sugar epimerase